MKEWNISVDPFEFLMDFSGSSMNHGGPNEGFLVLLDLILDTVKDTLKSGKEFD